MKIITMIIMKVIIVCQYTPSITIGHVKVVQGVGRQNVKQKRTFKKKETKIIKERNMMMIIMMITIK